MQEFHKFFGVDGQICNKNQSFFVGDFHVSSFLTILCRKIEVFWILGPSDDILGRPFLLKSCRKMYDLFRAGQFLGSCFFIFCIKIHIFCIFDLWPWPFLSIVFRIMYHLFRAGGVLRIVLFDFMDKHEGFLHFVYLFDSFGQAKTIIFAIFASVFDHVCQFYA